ncbi:MAG: hypothetical protein ACI88H_000429 [Cocleimonas sp.]|jgi:hypothetical protein
MLLLSEILLTEGEEISNFVELKIILQKNAITRGELFFNVDIEPPAYPDRPTDWHDQLNIAFESAR